MRTLDALSLTADTNTVNRALNWLETLGEHQGWPARTSFALTLCLDETLTNIVTHGKQPDQSATQIDITAYQHENDIILQITDNGPAFDPTVTDSPRLAESVDEAKIGGHGLRLMRHYLKDMQYSRDNNSNTLKLTAALIAGPR